MTFLSIKTLDELAIYAGYKDYESFKGLIYPQPLYRSFKIPKRNGEERLIESPGKRLKDIQRKIASDLVKIYGKRSPSAHAFVKSRSAVTNALPHTNRASVIRFDLEDFFHQVHFGRVKGMFMSAPFEFPNDVASVLAHLCCHQGRLPQGAPTSPVITNFVCLSLDRHLRRLARRFKARYTRYSDDLTFSFASLTLEKIPNEIFLVTKDLNGRVIATPGSLLTEAISKQGFVINAKKTIGNNRSKRQMVTGIVVNDGLSLPKKYISELRRALYIWENFGIDEATKKAIPVLHKKKYASTNPPSLIQLIRGKLAWIAKVTGRSSQQYQKLATIFNELVIFEEKPDLVVKIDPRVSNYQDAVKATWFVKSEQSNGGYEYVEGTAIRVKGNIWVTCAHCISNWTGKTVLENIKISSGDWKITDLPVRVVDVDWARDLATLRPIPLTSIPKNLAYFEASKNLPKPEDQVGILGYPSSAEHQPPIFMKSNVIRTRGYHGVSRIEIDKPILEGNSGGPVFDEHYKLVGIVVEGATVQKGMNSCIAIDELDHLRKF